jgi:hypothetical protein
VSGMGIAMRAHSVGIRMTTAWRLMDLESTMDYNSNPSPDHSMEGGTGTAGAMRCHCGEEVEIPTNVGMHVGHCKRCNCTVSTAFGCKPDWKTGCLLRTADR